MNWYEMAYCISYARGHHRIVGVSARHDFGGWTNNYLSEYVHKYISKGCPQTNKYLCFENDFSYMENSMCEGFGEDSIHGTRHVDIQVGICMIYLNVCLVVIA